MGKKKRKRGPLKRTGLDSNSYGPGESEMELSMSGRGVDWGILDDEESGFEDDDDLIERSKLNYDLDRWQEELASRESHRGRMRHRESKKELPHGHRPRRNRLDGEFGELDDR